MDKQSLASQGPGRIVIVMPAYNEASNISLMVHELFSKEFPKIEGAEMHLLVVDDYSPDGTGDVVKNLMGHHKNLHLLQKEKEGLGWAYIKGFEYAIDKLHADAVMEMDADFQHPPRFVKPMVEAYLDGADYVIGSRYIKGGSIPKEWALPRKFMSYFGNLYARIVLTKFSIHDMTTGFRLTKVKGVLDKIDLENLMEPRRFAHKIDLLYQVIKRAKNVKEVPLEFEARTKEKSKFNIKEMIASYKIVMILGVKDKIKFIKFGTVGFLGFLVNFVFLRLFRGLGYTETWAWALSTELAIINNYALNNIWTFKESKIKGLANTIKKFLQFNLTSAGAIVIQSVLGPLGVKLVGVKYDAIVLMVIILFIVLPYNYTMYNLFIWKNWKLPWAKKS